jgi:hypothetical protein
MAPVAVIEPGVRPNEAPKAAGVAHGGRLQEIALRQHGVSAASAAAAPDPVPYSFARWVR